MTLDAASQIAIHFVGLIVFTTQLESTVIPAQGLHPALDIPLLVAIVPNVTIPHGMARERKAKRVAFSKTRPSRQSHSSDPVQSHTALIAFRTADRRAVNGWLPIPIGRTDSSGAGPEWQYIVLSGERIRFQANGTNPRIQSLGDQVPHLIDQLQLSANSNYNLKPEYMSPYTGAAAVIDLPVGTLTTCASQVIGVQNRIDTQILVNHTGDLVITGETAAGPVKSLTLGEGAQIVFANVPLEYVETASGMDAGHYVVYCQMVNGNATLTRCMEPKLRGSATAGTTSCIDDVLRKINLGNRGRRAHHATAVARGPLPTAMLMNIECSNTQWP